MREYYKEIDKGGQMFDFINFYKNIASLLPNNSKVIEIGMANGKSSIFLAEEILNSNKSIDRFIGVDNCSYGGQDQRNEIIKNILGAKVNIDFFEMSSLDASCKFPDNYFDFIFLDSSHFYYQTRSEILLWYKKLKNEGILAGHDYFTHSEVKQAVDELIPLTVTREPLNETTFEPIDFLHTEKTDNNFGVWWVQKQWFATLNY